MNDHNDELLQRLVALDPVTTDAAPDIGSSRFHTMKEQAMSMTTTTPTTSPSHHRDATTEFAPRSEPPRRRRGVLVAAIAAIAALVATLTLTFASGGSADAAAVIRSAADGTADATSFRATLATEGHSFIPGGSASGEISGNAMRMVADGLEYIRIGDTEWVGMNGSFERQAAEDEFAPFTQASADVVRAALASENVEDRGAVVIGAQETQHYSVQLDDAARRALADVPPESQYWFVGSVDEEVRVTDTETTIERSGFLEDANRIDVWVADGLVHQIEVEDGVGLFRFTFYDFGADIVIEAPQ